MTMYLLPPALMFYCGTAVGYEHANEGHLFKVGITDLKNGHVWAWTCFI